MDTFEAMLEQSKTLVLELETRVEKSEAVHSLLVGKLDKARAGLAGLSGEIVSPEKPTRKKTNPLPQKKSANREVVEPILRGLLLDNDVLSHTDLRGLVESAVRDRGFSLSGFSRVFKAIESDLLIEIRPGVMGVKSEITQVAQG